MKLLIFDAAAQDTLVEQGREVHGGEPFLVDDDRAEDLLTQPHLPVLEVTEDLTALTREQLNDLAATAGVQNPEKLQNKDAVIASLNVTAREPVAPVEPEPVHPALEAGTQPDAAPEPKPEAESAGPAKPNKED